MDRTLEIIQDGEPLLHFECAATLSALQRRQLAQLDQRLDQGFELDGERIGCPDRDQRVRFVIGQLLHVLQRGEAPAVRGLCTWLGQRVPELSAIRIHTRAEELEVELDYGPGAGSDV
ncbi:MAG: hypothetical protein OQL11_12025 [Gammaproteobacteria bacterium]|nr:hypothetical protein [Gammaproteobacteria bacterium]